MSILKVIRQLATWAREDVPPVEAPKRREPDPLPMPKLPSLKEGYDPKGRFGTAEDDGCIYYVSREDDLAGRVAVPINAVGMSVVQATYGNKYIEDLIRWQ